MKLGKRLLSVLVALFVALSLIPATAFTASASQTDSPSDFEGTVYVTYSHDGRFAKGNTDSGYMAYVPIDIADVASDSEIYPGEYPYDADGDGTYEVTELMVYQYVLKEYGLGLSDFYITGMPGSTYIENGFWHDEDGEPWDQNLNYYYDGMFPLMERDDGIWGATSDQITIHEEDFIDVGHFTDWGWYSDENAGFQYFAGDEYITDYKNESVQSATIDNIPLYVTHQFNGTAGEPIEAALIRAFGDFSNTDSATLTVYTPFNNTVYYGTTLYQAEGSWTSGTTGIFNMTFDTAGDYWIWTNGTGDPVVNAPAIARVTITQGTEPSGEDYVIYNNPLPIPEGIKGDLEGMGLPADTFFDELKVSLKGATVVSKTPDSLDALAYTVVLDSATAPDAVLDLEVIATAAPILETLSSMLGAELYASYDMTPGTVQLENGSATVRIEPDVFSGGDSQYWQPETIVINFTIGGTEPPVETFSVTLPEDDNYTIIPTEGSESPVISGGDFSFTITFAEGYEASSQFAVKANGTELTADENGVYTISSIAADQVVSVEGVVETQTSYEVTLPTGDGYTIVYTGDTTVARDADFIFKVEVADGWKTANSFAVKANGTVLEADAEGEYVISGIRENKTVTVEGIYQPAFITAPAGTEIIVGAQLDYYRYVYVDWEEKLTTEDGQIQFLYQPVRGPQDLQGYMFLRATNPNGVTYTRFLEPNRLEAGQKIVVTAEDLYLNDESFTSSTVYHNFEYNNLDLGDIYLNINEQGYLALDAGDTYELNSFRNWYAIESTQNGKVALPDMHYEVVDITGNPSDLVTIVPDEHNSCVATLTAGNGSGMAIIKITYDAMTHTEAMAEDFGAGGEDSTRFSAIWPERTGIIVVTVGQDGTGISTNMTFRDGLGKAAGNKLDAEHDPLFYVGSKGASYSFAPEAGTTVTVARPTVGDTMTYNGFTSEGVNVADDGTVTITGLYTGRTIVKVEKDGLANYQVITAQEVSYTLGDTEGNIYDANHIFKPGDTVRVTFSGLTSPAEKLSGYYNFNFGIKVVGEDGTAVKEKKGGEAGAGYYGFSAMNHYVDITIPEDWKGNTYTLTDGWIQVGGYAGGAIGDHRSCTYAKGKGMTHGSDGNGELGQLPVVTIPVVSFSKHNLLLSGEIGVLFLVKFPEGFDTTDCYMEFVAKDGRTGTMQYADATADDKLDGVWFQFDVNALELADEITATLYYGDGETLVDKYSAMTYIETALNDPGYSQKGKTLVSALQTYGFYLQNSGWTDGKEHTAIAAPAQEMTEDSIAAAKSGLIEMGITDITKNLEDSGITDAKFTLVLNSKTVIGVYVKPESGAKVTSTGFKKTKLSGEVYYLYKTPKIGPKNLGKLYTVEAKTNVGTATVEGSAMSYVKAALNNDGFTEAKKLALTAYYYYYLAARAY